MMGMSLAAFGIVSGALKQPTPVGLLAGIPFVILAIMLRGWEANRQQGVRDTDAASLLERIGRGDVPRYSLYLRTFAVTGKLQTGRRAYETVSPHYVGPDLDFETLLGETVESDAPLVALGRPGEHVGAGRIVTDDATWKADILRLAEQAVTIFVIPSGRPGTAWEIDTIVRNGLWEKAVFLMPPGARGTLAVTWDEDRNRLAAAGVTIPKYTTAGMVFTLDNRGQVRGRASFSREGFKLIPSALRKAIREAQSDAATTPDVDASAIPPAAALVTSEKCPKCGGAKVRPQTVEERKAMKTLTKPTLDDLSANLDRPDELDEFSRRATCADCGTTYLRPPNRIGGLTCFITSAISGALLYGVFRSRLVEEVIRWPRVEEVLMTAGCLLVLGVLSLAFPFWCASKLFGLIHRKRSGSGAPRSQ